MAWRALNDNTLQTAQSSSLGPSNCPDIEGTAVTKTNTRRLKPPRFCKSSKAVYKIMGGKRMNQRGCAACEEK
jgi:hypothetical protein